MPRSKIVRCTKGCGAKISAISEDEEILYSTSVKIHRGQYLFALILPGLRIKLCPIKNSGRTGVEFDANRIGSLELGSWNDVTDNSVVKQFELNKLSDRLGNNSNVDVYVTVTKSCFKNCFEEI